MLFEEVYELQPRLHARGDIPAFTLYEDGEVVFQEIDPKKMEFVPVRAQIGAASATAFADELAATGLLDLPKSFSTVFASDLPRAQIALRRGSAWKLVDGYGVTRPGEDVRLPKPETPAPRAFMDAYGKIVALVPPKAEPFRPAEIEALLTPSTQATEKPHPWPAGVPAPLAGFESPPNPYSFPFTPPYRHKLEARHAPLLEKLEGEPVLVDERRWRVQIAWRVPAQDYIERVRECVLGRDRYGESVSCAGSGPN